MKVYIKGLNVCSLRRQSLLHYRHFLEKNGHEVVPDPHDSEVILIRTCGFRRDVIENSISELNRYQREYAGKVIALGCLPDINRELLKNRFRGIIAPWREEASFFEQYFHAPAGSFATCSPVFHENVICDNAAEYRRLHPNEDASFADQFFKLLIGQGCPYKCTYCTENLAFPPYKSVNEDDLVEACRMPVEQQGQRRIMLMADCLGVYGSDIGSSLPQLIRHLHYEYPQTAYYLSYFHPKDFLDYYEDMKKFLENDWILHLNLPVQSASDRVLSAMNRQYTRQDLDKVFGLLIDMNFNSFDTHIIVGFPGETDSDFMETIDFLREYRPTYTLISKYYNAPHTQSSRMSNKIDDNTMSRRLQVIEDEVKKIGIVYSIDGSGFIQDKLRRINRQAKII